MNNNEKTITEGQSNHTLPVPARSRWKKRILVGAVAVCLVVSGMVIGAGAATMRMKRFHLATAQSPQCLGNRLVERVSKHFTLGTDDKGRVKAVIDSRIQTISHIRERSNGDIYREFEDMRDDVAKLLQPQDAVEWNKRINYYLEKFAPNR